jgi:hypothetical protein
MKIKVLLTILTGLLLAPLALCDDDGMAVGVIEWEPGLRREATMYDKTDLWAAIAFSPSTGKYGSTCEWESQDNAVRVARECCNARDARCVVLCCNGWCSLALSDPPVAGETAWGVGWGEDRETAERYALENARQRANRAKVVYSVFARDMRVSGVIAYSPATGRWGYSCGYGRGDVTRALKFCEDPNARYFVAPSVCCWMALALGDDQSAYGWGYAGNQIDAERNALEECRKRTKNAKVAISFCTNGVVY